MKTSIAKRKSPVVVTTDKALDKRPLRVSQRKMDKMAEILSKAPLPVLPKPH